MEIPMKFQSDIISDNGHMTVLVLFDLSAAFDVINPGIHLTYPKVLCPGFKLFTKLFIVI